MKTGVVLTIENNRAVIMRTGGKFLSVDARPDWKKGDVVSVRDNRIPVVGTMYAVAACLLLFIFGAGGYRAYNIEISTISLDVNPSIAMSLNRYDRIIDATGYNDESLAVLDSVSLKHKTYTEAIRTLLVSEPLSSRINSEHGALVKVAVHSDIEEKNQQIVSALSAEAELRPDERYGRFVDFEIVSREVVDEARENGMTPGKYTEVLEIRELNPNIDIKDLRGLSVRELREYRETINRPYAEDPSLTEETGMVAEAPAADEQPNEEPGKEPDEEPVEQPEPAIDPESTIVPEQAKEPEPPAKDKPVAKDESEKKPQSKDEDSEHGDETRDDRRLEKLLNYLRDRVREQRDRAEQRRNQPGRSGK